MRVINNGNKHFYSVVGQQSTIHFGSDLVVLSIGLSLGIKNTRPVISLKVCLVVNINLYLNSLALCLDGVGWYAHGVEETAN